MGRIQGIEVKPVTDITPQINMLLWGQSGAGKTTLACTMPGKKLLLCSDPNGANSVASREDVMLYDISDLPYSQGKQLMDRDPFGLDGLIQETGCDSVIFDSLTTLGDLAVNYGISEHSEKGWDGGSIIKPHRDAYGARLNLVNRLCINVLKICKRHEKHVCFTAHEATPDKDKEGVVQSISLLLGGQLPNSLGVQFSEIWALYDLPGNKKMIGIRACRMRAPMKSRMFDVSKHAEFLWDFDPLEQSGETIAEWHEQWLASDKRKLRPPV